MVKAAAATPPFYNFSNNRHTENSRNYWQWRRPLVRIPLLVDLLRDLITKNGVLCLDHFFVIAIIFNARKLR
ncbi:hypothetical protein T4B_13876 [Trichinella pseudospiralis]|uniref:Uncharacterized protein n=1 Tax=Trichinella pseudospiralis TaxID=6337 RepID=A0A0V1GQJ7_TRIPS|nr:hypothetical protein T4B_13876 [Trichinella pseudospiralis]